MTRRKILRNCFENFLAPKWVDGAFKNELKAVNTIDRRLRALRERASKLARKRLQITMRCNQRALYDKRKALL